MNSVITAAVRYKATYLAGIGISKRAPSGSGCSLNGMINATLRSCRSGDRVNCYTVKEFLMEDWPQGGDNEVGVSFSPNGLKSCEL